MPDPGELDGHRGAGDRVPAGWERACDQRPDRLVLGEAGFDPLGAFRFPTQHGWSAEGLIGFAYSTSLLPRPTLGSLTADFEADLRSALDPFDPTALRQTIDFAYELFRRPIQCP